MATEERRSLERVLQDAVCDYALAMKMSERESLELAMSAADGWKMRLRELEEEDEDEQPGSAL